ncbi:MAG: hypothetical protein DWQ34_12415 [Planctomycetota bacterium]|nr:MAG: hypothetical protein DWQ29_18940 [Planctomycetota bacterium]REJ92610.1 MAG: hypothetical protein DWQ34_12415 [Planctomycetota bacterium]REK28311.1 MAG: hypothetical protein DWQ45_24940 [Planctomycetota bacterium]
MRLLSQETNSAIIRGGRLAAVLPRGAARRDQETPVALSLWGLWREFTLFFGRAEGPVLMVPWREVYAMDPMCVDCGHNPSAFRPYRIREDVHP